MRSTARGAVLAMLAACQSEDRGRSSIPPEATTSIAPLTAPGWSLEPLATRPLDEAFAARANAMGIAHSGAALQEMAFATSSVDFRTQWVAVYSPRDSARGVTATIEDVVLARSPDGAQARLHVLVTERVPEPLCDVGSQPARAALRAMPKIDVPLAAVEFHQVREHTGLATCPAPTKTAAATR